VRGEREEEVEIFFSNFDIILTDVVNQEIPSVRDEMDAFAPNVDAAICEDLGNAFVCEFFPPSVPRRLKDVNLGIDNTNFESIIMQGTIQEIRDASVVPNDFHFLFLLARKASIFCGLKKADLAYS